jgi:outer membrane cobalamin receptor
MKSYFYIALLLFGSISLIFANVWADETNPEATDEEIVVTATRTEQTSAQSPGVTEVTTKEEIENHSAATISEAMNVNGVPVATYGGTSGTASIMLDGSTAEQTMVMVNGIPVNTGTMGAGDFSFFPTAGVQKIETVHGPLSALYGANALGGVVNIITDLTGSPQTQLDFSGGSFNTRSLGLSLQQNNWGIAAGGNFTDGFRSRTGNNGNYLMAQYDFSDHPDQYLKLYGNYMAKFTEVPGSITYPSTNAWENDRSSGINLQGKGGFLSGVWEYKVFGQYLDTQYHDDYADDRYQTWNYGIDCAGLYSVGNHELLAGGTYKYLFSDSTLNNGQHSSSNFGLYLQDNWAINDHFNMVSGVRYDYFTNFPAPISPRISLGYAATPNVTLKIGYGKAFRAPTVNELYCNQPAFNMFGDPNLKPEEGERIDLISEWRKESQSFTVNAFHSYAVNGIKWIYDGSSTTVKNMKTVNTTGLNLAWTYTWEDRFMGKIRYRWQDELMQDDIGTARYNFFGANQVELEFGVKINDWQILLGWKYAGDRSKQLQTGDPMPDYNVGNLSVAYRPNKVLTWILAVDNLANQDYQIQYDYPMPGMDVSLRMKYIF